MVYGSQLGQISFLKFLCKKKLPFFPVFFLCLATTFSLLAQNGENQKKAEIKAPENVDVKPTALDAEISDRLENILESTGWFIDPKVHVREGVVFLSGQTEKDEYKEWAEKLAGNTQDTVAVVNQIDVLRPSIWDFQPVIKGLREQWRGFLKIIPTIFFGLVILVVAWLLAKATYRLSWFILSKKIENPLLVKMITWSIGTGIFLIGLYSVFHLMGLTTIALTVLGGTGLLGIILGIAFKDITENLLASIFLSINNPFHKGDLIEIEGITGYVQSLTIRSTILISLDGNYIQIPNATVYKSNIRNFTSNPNRREDFIVGIGYDCVISEAQDTALKVLQNHPAVLKDPEPWVLVDRFGKSTINLKIYFWLDGRKHSWLKVRSSVIRLVKKAFQSNRIDMPDEARELIFPKGITVWMASAKPEEKEAKKLQEHQETDKIATRSEGELNSEAKDIQEQGSQSQIPEPGKNLLNQKRKPNLPDNVS